MSPNKSRASASDPEFAPESAKLLALTRDLTGNSETPEGLMREHLEAANFYLVGDMPHEYGHTLDLARELLPTIKDESLRSRLADFLKSQPTGRED